MKKMSETIVFFGSGPVAAASLALLAEDFDIEAVITKPQPAHHKEPFPVLGLAAKLGIRTLTPSNGGELSELFGNKPVTSKIGVVIDYGIIIDQAVIDYFPLGIVNSHFSLLPRWRGADPISFAILEGDTETGVSLMLIVEKLDEGPLLAQASAPITPETTTPSLTKALIALSHELLVENLPKYLSGRLEPKPQSSKGVTYSRKLTKADGRIDWNKTRYRLDCEIRAFLEWPKSRTTLSNTEVIITQAHGVPGSTDGTKPGDIEVIKDGGVLMVYCKDGYLCIEKLKPAGKPEMTAEAFLAGYKL